MQFWFWIFFQLTLKCTMCQVYRSSALYTTCPVNRSLAARFTKQPTELHPHWCVQEIVNFCVRASLCAYVRVSSAAAQFPIGAQIGHFRIRPPPPQCALGCFVRRGDYYFVWLFKMETAGCDKVAKCFLVMAEVKLIYKCKRSQLIEQKTSEYCSSD
jgi:hypothetical protein